MAEESTPFAGWAILELMGHRRLGGHVEEVQLAGAGFLRIDVPAVGDLPAATQLYSPGAVYCLTPTTEAMARAAAGRGSVRPAERWELAALERGDEVVPAELVDVAWVQLHREGDALRRYLRSLGKAQDGSERPDVVLAQRGEETWTAGLWWRSTGEKRVLLADADMETAQGVAEDYVRAHAPALASTDAAWRKRKPKPTAVEAAKKWRLPGATGFKTAGELSDALDAHVARIKARQGRK